MTLVGPVHLVYLPTPAFRTIMARYVDPDDYSAIYEVAGRNRSEVTTPSEGELSLAHWKMFLALLYDEFADLRRISEARGFEACWEVHRIELERGAELIEDVTALPDY